MAFFNRQLRNEHLDQIRVCANERAKELLREDGLTQEWRIADRVRAEMTEIRFVNYKSVTGLSPYVIGN